MIRIFFLLGFVLCNGVFACAQQNDTSHPPVAITKHSWSKERINWNIDPFGGPVEGFGDMRVRVYQERRVADLKKAGDVGEANKQEQVARADQAAKVRPKPPRYAFLYKASFKNNASKAIKTIDWDYVFHDAVNGEELGRREFTTEEEIAPGKTKDFSYLIDAPPTQRISVYALGKKEHEGLRADVIVMRVAYADGTVWQIAP